MPAPQENCWEHPNFAKIKFVVGASCSLMSAGFPVVGSGVPTTGGFPRSLPNISPATSLRKGVAQLFKTEKEEEIYCKILV
jgi:hypothetical protein